MWHAARAAARSGEGVVAASAATLLLAGDAYTCWNVRKRALADPRVDAAALQAELAFNALVLRRHAKAPCAPGLFFLVWYGVGG